MEVCLVVDRFVTRAVQSEITPASLHISMISVFKTVDEDPPPKIANLHRERNAYFGSIT